MASKIYAGTNNVDDFRFYTYEVSLFLDGDRKYPLCDESTAYTASDVAASTVEANATTNTVTWKYTCVVTYPSCSTDTTTGTSSSSVTFTQNTTNSQRTISGNISWNNITIPYRFYQKGVPKYVAPTAKTGLAYNGSVQSLVNVGSVTGGTFEYKVGNGNWSESIPSATTVGSYTVYWRIKGDSTHSNVDGSSFTVSIGRASRTITFTSAPTTLIRGNSGTLSATVSAGSGDGTISYNTSNDTVAAINGNTVTGVESGSCTITATISQGANYASASTSYTIETVEWRTSPNDMVWEDDLLWISSAATRGYVDLGLPSGAKWAKTNIGAASETEYGNYYQYGKGASQYSTTSGESAYSGTESPLTINLDAAAQEWGGDWHMPTQSQFNELTANTTYSWVTIDGVSGAKFTAANGNYVFFPAAGNYNNGSQSSVGTNGYYWSSTPSSTNSYGLTISSGSESVSSNSRNYGFTIRPIIGKDPITPAVTMSGWSYGSTASEPSVSGNLGNGTVTYNYKVSTAGDDTYTVTKPSNVGTYTVRAQIAETVNFTSGSCTTNFTISKGSGQVISAPGAKSLSYNGSPQELVTAGAGTGTMMYSLDNSTFSESIPTATNIGTYIIYYYAAASANYTQSTTGSVTSTIANQVMTYTAPNPTTYSYNGNSRNLASGASATNGTIQYSTSIYGTYSTTIPTSVNAGSYTIYWKAVPNPGYSGGYGPASITTNISKADQSAPTAYGDSTSYGGTATATAGGGGEKGSIEWSNGNTQTSVGSKTTKARWSGNSNYNASPWSNEVSITITKASQSAPTATGGTATYGGTATATAAGGGGAGTLTWTNGSTRTAVGTGTTAAYWSGNSNYNASPNSNTVYLIVNPANPTYTAPTANNRTYDGTSKALLNAGAVTGGTIYYSTDNSSWSTSIPTATNAGIYTTYWKITGDANHNDKASASITTTIGKASRTLSWSRSASTLSVNMRAGILAEPSAGSTDGSITYKSSNTSVATIGYSTVIGNYVEGVGAGTCTITATISEGNNYLSASTSFTVTVSSPKAIIVVNTPGGKRNPQVIFMNTNNQSESTVGSYVGGGTFQVTWSYGGTVNKLVLSNNSNNIPYLSVYGDGGTLLLDRTSLDGAGSTQIINLTTSFDAGNYQTYGKTLTLNFTDV